MAEEWEFYAAVHGVKVELERYGDAKAESNPEISEEKQAKIDKYLTSRIDQKRAEINGR